MAEADGIAKRLTTRSARHLRRERRERVGVRAIVEQLGGLDVLVNAAGILRAAHTHECTLEMWNQVIDVNLTGTYPDDAVPRSRVMLESGHGRDRELQLDVGAFGHPYMAAYAASKGGIDAFTHTIAIEYGKRGIRAVGGRARQHRERHHRDHGGHAPRRRRLDVSSPRCRRSSPRASPRPTSWRR